MGLLEDTVRRHPTPVCDDQPQYICRLMKESYAERKELYAMASGNPVNVLIRRSLSMLVCFSKYLGKKI